MVAFLRPETPSRPSHPRPPDPGLDDGRHLRLVVDNTGSGHAGGTGHQASPTHSGSPGPGAGSGRPMDRLRTSPDPRTVHGSIQAMALAAALIAGALLAVRLAQGEPPAGGWAGTVAAASSSVGVDVAAPGPDDLVVVVAPGDSLWSIARRYAPEHDRRDAIATLADLNGSSTLQVGQKVVIPQELLE